MPLDATKLRQLTVTVLPQRDYRPGVFTLWLLALLLLVLLAALACAAHELAELSAWFHDLLFRHRRQRRAVDR
jgi:hypothetical protein